MKNTVDFKFVEDGYVEIILEESRFRLAIDEHGLPKFPELLKEKLPPYLPEMVERWIKVERHNPQESPTRLAVSHRPWCREIRETGRCNCNPTIIDLKIREYTGVGDGKLTCRICEESSIGEEILGDVVENDTGVGYRFWIEGGDMFYWLMGIRGTDIRLLICHLCMIELGIKFPNPLESDTNDKDEDGYLH